MNEVRNPFRILGLSPDAEMEVVRAAYRALARKYHPDVAARPDAQRLMRDINWAKDELERDAAKWRTKPSARTAKQRADSPPPANITQQEFSAYVSQVILIVNRANSAIRVYNALCDAHRKCRELDRAPVWKAAMIAVADEYDAVVRDNVALTYPRQLSTMGQIMQRWASGHSDQSRRIRSALSGNSGACLGERRDIRENNELIRQYLLERTTIARQYGFSV